LLRQLATEDGRAVVIVSHDARLEQIVDRGGRQAVACVKG
jgi:hypothetical protein